MIICEHLGLGGGGERRERRRYAGRAFVVAEEVGVVVVRPGRRKDQESNIWMGTFILFVTLLFH